MPLFDVATRTRFKSKVNSRSKARCHVWTGCKNYENYGWFKYKGRMFGAHRFAWMLSCGPIPEGLLVLHRCDNPSCVRIDHLFLGSNADNTKDKVQKKRHPHGVTNGRAKLSVSDVKTIRRIHAKGKVTMNYLAKRYGVTGPMISNIVNRRAWKHL